MNNLKYTVFKILLLLIYLFLINSVSYSQINVSSGTYFNNSGSITLNDIGLNNNGNFNGSGSTIVFAGSSNSAIGGNGNYTVNNITINKSANTVAVMLNCNLTVIGTLTLTSGDFDVNNKTLTLGSTATLSGESNNNLIISTAESNKGTVTTARNLMGAVSGYTFGNIGISVTTTQILGSTTVIRGFLPVTVGSYTGIEKTFILAPANNSGLNATYVLNYFGNELTEGLNPVNMVLYQSTDNGATYFEVTGNNNWNAGTQSGSLTATGINTFGTENIWTASDYNNPLPIVLESFTSKVNGRDLILEWITSEEYNNAGFEIQRLETGNPGSLWKKIGYLEGKGTINSPTTYNYKQSKLNSGKFKYRLKQIDVNGNFEYYDLNEVIEILTPKNFEMSQNYPNPFNPSTKIDIDVPFNSRVKVIIYDLAGREVNILLNRDLQAGFYTIDFYSAGLSSGVYFYRITAGNYVKTLKMLLLK